MSTPAQELAAILLDMGLEIAADHDSVVRYMKQRAAHLVTVHGQEGYQRALQTEGINVALFAMGVAIDEADRLDQRLVSVLTTLLTIVVRTVLVV